MLLPPERRRSTFDAKVAAAYLAGTTTGALVTAGTAWVLSGLVAPLGDEVRLGLLAAGGAFAWGCKHGPLAGVVDLPEMRRQIPSHVFGGRLAAAAYRFGLELGTGMRTHVPTAAPYVLLLAVLLSRPTLAGALLMGLGFGFGRALPILARMLPRLARRRRAYWRATDPVAATAATVVVLAGGLALV